MLTKHLSSFLRPILSTKSSQFVSKPSSLTSNRSANSLSIGTTKDYSFLNKKTTCSFCTHPYTQSLIGSLQENVKGSEFLQKGQYLLAIREFQLALKFLPKDLNGDGGQYKAEYEKLVQKLLQSHVMMNKPVKQFITLYQQYLDKNSKFGKFIQTLQQLQNQDYATLQQLQPQGKLWKQIVRAFSFKSAKQCFGKHIPISQIHQTKDLQLKYIGLYLYEKIKARKNKQRQDIYLNTCRQLLKQTQQFEPQKIVKPLSLMACNLLAGDQFLQAEGLMSHCLSVLEQFYHLNQVCLKTDQQYIMCKLLIARVFDGVRRHEEAKKIRDQYQPFYDEKKFFIQELSQISYREL